MVQVCQHPVSQRAGESASRHLACGFMGVGAAPTIREGQSAAGICQAPPTGSGLECKAGTKHESKRHKNIHIYIYIYIHIYIYTFVANAICTEADISYNDISFALIRSTITQ